MVPVLRDGDFVLTRPGFRTPRVGSLVVVDHPRYNTIVKRVAGFERRATGEVFLKLTGENDSGVRTDEIGWVPKKAIRGRVWLKVRKGKSGPRDCPKD